MRKRRLILNTITSLFTQIVVAICGLILPRIILSNYGSEINGLVSSITQFLGIIAFMELGVGAVAQSAMYKPLANNDQVELSKIMISAKKFFQNIAKIYIIYIILLLIGYPLLINKSFNYLYTGSLILIIAINSFAEYYFGIVNQQLLNADQKSYVHLIIRSITQIINTILCVVFIRIGSSIHEVKLITSIVFLFRPILMGVYVKKHYHIDYKINVIEEPIKQKWNGLAQHMAAVVLDKTDIIVLTIFSTLNNVSIYTVYYLVVNNLRQLITSGTIGLQSLIGNLLAKKEDGKLKKMFDLIEIVTHLVISLIFVICGILIVPFVEIYTRGINDVNYIVPLFAVIITLANAMYCFRNSYNLIIKAAGYYKETQNSAIIEMIINIVVSMVTVIKFGLVGVAIGTLLAMTYRTFYLVWFLSKNIIFRPMKHFLKNICIDVIIVLIIIIINYNINIKVENYIQLGGLAIVLLTIGFIVATICNAIFYKSKVIKIFNIAKNRWIKKEKHI